MVGYLTTKAKLQKRCLRFGFMCYRWPLRTCGKRDQEQDNNERSTSGVAKAIEGRIPMQARFAQWQHPCSPQMRRE